jgi:hypothetical protein
MKTKVLIATLFLCLGLVSVSVSGCSFGGHIGTSQGSVSIG